VLSGQHGARRPRRTASTARTRNIRPIVTCARQLR
jgi:hypothetical protein